MNQGLKYGAVFLAGVLSVGGGIAIGYALGDNDDDLPRGNVVSMAPSTTQSAPLPAQSETPAVPAQSGSLTAIADLQRGQTVMVQGVVQRISDEDEFILADDTGTVEVWTGNTFFTVETGEQVTVRGFVDDDLRLEIYAQEIVKGDGTTVSIDNRSGY